MNIKTLSEISLTLHNQSNFMMLDDIMELAQTEETTPDLVSAILQRGFNNSASDLPNRVWKQVQVSLATGFPLKASLAKDLGDFNKDPVRILVMLLLNLSPAAVSELREALGIPELTQSP
jgi:hypothetical protein